MLEKFSSPSPDSPLSPFAWRMLLYIYGAYIALCLVIIGFHIASHSYESIYLLVLSMLSGLGILNDLWTGVERGRGDVRLEYKKSPMAFWIGVLAFLFVTVELFYLGSGWYVPSN
jgi:hypothetical protein